MNIENVLSSTFSVTPPTSLPPFNFNSTSISSLQALTPQSSYSNSATPASDCSSLSPSGGLSECNWLIKPPISLNEVIASSNLGVRSFPFNESAAGIFRKVPTDQNNVNDPGVPICQKPPRLTCNGKRVGRPPGTNKVYLKKLDSVVQCDNGEEVHECRWNRCHKTFTNKNDFYAHMALHVNSDTRICLWDGCDRPMFSAFYQLTAHLRTHTKEKPHECDWENCGKKYSRRENLKTHRRTHTGEKPYACDYAGCLKKFSNASDCAKHRNRTHSSLKPYFCLVENCGKSYTDPSSLRKHFKAIHPDLMPKYSTGQYRAYQPKIHSHRKGSPVHQPEHQLSSAMCLPVFNPSTPSSPMMPNPFLFPPLTPFPLLAASMLKMPLQNSLMQNSMCSFPFPQNQILSQCYQFTYQKIQQQAAMINLLTPLFNQMTLNANNFVSPLPTPPADVSPTTMTTGDENQFFNFAANPVHS